MQFIVGLLLAFGAFWLVSWLQKLPAEHRRRWLKRGLLWSVAGLLLLMVVTGRLHILAALGAGLLWLLARLPAMLKYYQWLRRQNPTAERGAEGDVAAPVSTTMSEQEALDILGLTTGASDEDIIDSHRLLIQKLHPDRGGSHWLATRINLAKDTLLSRRR